LNDETQVDLYILLKITPYNHPIGIPLGGVHWQLAKDPDFANIVLESRRITSADSILIATDPATSQTYLETNTTYFWRARYFDLRDTNSDWSDVWSFTTDVVARENVIVQPDILHPYKDGVIPERGFFSSVSSPIHIGIAVPNSMDYQIAITPEFNASDVLIDKPNQNRLTDIFIDVAEADFRFAPSPLYARVRHKDTDRNIKSRWSPVPTLWIQRVFRDVVVGREVRIDKNNNQQVIFWIDRNGNHVAPESGYWHDSPIWSSLVKVNFTAPAADSWVCCRVPSFFTRAESEENIDEIIHRYWVSKSEFEGSYLHPAFVFSQTGFLLTNFLLFTKINGVDLVTTNLKDGITLATNALSTPSQWYTYIKNSNLSGSERIIPYNIHAKCAIQLLALIENGVKNMNLIPAIYRGIGNINSSARHLYTFISHNFTGNVLPESQSPLVAQFGIPSTYNPDNKINFSIIGDPGSDNFKYVSKIKTGFNSMLQAHLELYNIPDYFSADPSMWDRYYSRINANVVNGYDLSNRSGELSNTDSNSFVENDYTFGVNLRQTNTDTRVYARALVLD
jgi:hypothetical protein